MEKQYVLKVLSDLINCSHSSELRTAVKEGEHVGLSLTRDRLPV